MYDAGNVGDPSSPTEVEAPPKRRTLICDQGLAGMAQCSTQSCATAASRAVHGFPPRGCGRTPET